MEYKNILFEVADGVATITINRPKALNALNSDVMCELYDAAIKCKTDEAIKVVRQGIAANEQSGLLQYALGVLAEGSGDAATAKKAFLEAERLDPQNVETQYHLATVALNQNDKAGAIARLEKFVAAAPAGTPNVDVAKSLLAALQKK